MRPASREHQKERKQEEIKMMNCKVKVLSSEEFCKQQRTMAAPIKSIELPKSSIEELELPSSLRERLYEHQVLGVEWLYNLHKADIGGILGDDMGLGKTFQVTAFLTGLYRQREIERVLVICPVSVMQSWQRELATHLIPNSKVCCCDHNLYTLSSSVDSFSLSLQFTNYNMQTR